MKEEMIIEILDIEGDGNHLLIKPQINLQQVYMIIDTGASRTVLDKTRLSEISGAEFISSDRLSTGLGTNSMTSEKVVLNELAFGKIKIPDYEAVVLDLSHVNQSYAKLGYHGIDGVLGGDILLKLNAVIDYKRGRLVLEESS